MNCLNVNTKTLLTTIGITVIVIAILVAVSLHSQRTPAAYVATLKTP